MRKKTLPDNYQLDDQGRQVLTGLTFEETIEFAILEAVPPKTGAIKWEAVPASFPKAEARWLELWEKHLAACRLLGK